MNTAIHPAKHNRFKRLVALAIGLSIALVTLAIVEFGFHYLNKRVAESEQIDYGPYGTPNEFRLILGYRPKGAQRYSTVKRVRGEVVYEAMYETDEFHRRATDHPADPEHFLAIFGGSFAFGEGLSNGETLADTLAERLPSRALYNFGYSGYGSQHALVQISHDETWAGVNETSGDGLYLLIPHHIMRASGSMRVVTQWGRHFPAYRLENDTLIHEGTFEQARPWRNWLYGIAAREQILRYGNVDWPLAPRDQDIELTAALLAAARDALHARGGNHFAVIMYPSPSWNAVDVDAVRDALLRRDLEVIDYTADQSLAEMVIEGDGHPNAEAFAYLADHLVQFLPWLRDE